MDTIGYEHKEESPVSIHKLILKNHITFLESHRGKVKHIDGSIAIASEREEFTLVICNESELSINLLTQYRKFFLPPWCSRSEPDLVDFGFREKGALIYMVRNHEAPLTIDNPSVKVHVVSTREEMNIFSDVQCRGFENEGEEYNKWFPFLRDANLQNLDNPEQQFLLAYIDGKPAGTTLLVHDGFTAGIYAVATLRNFRNRGISSCLLNHVISGMKRKKGEEILTLQVFENSYAEKLYRKLGFSDSFRMRIFLK